MTSAGPYQSRLFNLILRQGRQWRDRVRQKLRGLKLFSRWTLELLAVPLLAFWRSRDQVPTMAGQPAAEPTALPSDHPVQDVLAIAQRWTFELAKSPRSWLQRRPPSAIVRGVATDLSDRSLVLVDHQNQLLSLSSEQRLLLQQRLVWWLAQRRQLLSSRRRFSLRGLRSLLLLPFRPFTQLLQLPALAIPEPLELPAAATTHVQPLAGTPLRVGLPPTITDTTLDAQVTSVRYIQHPLQFLVDWLDRAIAWCEQGFLRLWQWLRSIWDR
ncbi:hypothetical protein [Synechococcus elongatus]|uniref:Uncharacterized protein n=1 Tax=Synechococcus elongatus PCC 11802 TaxID=2283154 RepID=A0AAT9JQD9_SYNEL|nr:hypothetical protein [Synechococcus elongatus]QFZ92726.1 hypothetical protein EKO22_10640 [Synechococcus elongatus PCC 11802]